MVIFNSYVTNYQRVVEFLHFCSPKIGWPDCHGSPRRDPASDGSNVSSPGIVIWIPNGHWSWLRNHQSCLSFQGVSIYIYGYMDIYPYIHIYIYGGFPKWVVPLNHPLIDGIFHEINHLAIGVPTLETCIYLLRKGENDEKSSGSWNIIFIFRQIRFSTKWIC